MNVKLERIVFLLDESWVGEYGETIDGEPFTRRESEDIDEFAAAVGQASQVAVTVEDVAALSGGLDAALILCEEYLVDDLGKQLAVRSDDLIRQVFLLNVEGRPRSSRHVDRLGAAGAIEGMRYFVWRTEREDAPGGGVLGRKEVAVRMGAHWPQSDLWETERYCFMEHDNYPTLPSLLGAYLRAYAAMMPELCG